MQPENILFIGNSLSFSNEGIDDNLKGLVGSNQQAKKFMTERYYLPGAYLETFWGVSNLREMIANGDYDVIILQEFHFQTTSLDSFPVYTRLWVAEIREKGAIPVLFMPNSADGGLTTDEVAPAYEEIAKELNPLVAPLGLAWQRVNEEQPDPIYTKWILYIQIFLEPTWAPVYSTQPYMAKALRD